MTLPLRWRSCRCVQVTNLFRHDIPLLLDIELVLIERRFIGLSWMELWVAMM